MSKVRIILFGLVLGSAGCGTLPDGSGWGQDAFTCFDSNRIAKDRKSVV